MAHKASLPSTLSPVIPAQAAAMPRRSPRTLTSPRAILLGGVILAASGAGIAQAIDSKALWEKHCIQCHGQDGKGLTKMGKKLKIRDLTDQKVQAELTDDLMRKSIREGVKDATGKVRMKPAENVSDAEIDALVSYVRTLKGN